MSSLSPSISTRNPFSPSPFFPSLPKPSRVSVPRVSCKATSDDNQNPTTRRDVLLGVGGLYCATSTTLIDPFVYVVNKQVMEVARAAAETKNPLIPANAFPLVLDKAIRTVVSRPKKSRTAKQKEEEEEVLVIQGIELQKDVGVKFDVYVNDEEDSSPSGPDKTEFAGSFVNVPHKKGNKKMSTSLRLGITDLLEDLGAEDDDTVSVSLVPRYGTGLVRVSEIKIEFDED